MPGAGYDIGASLAASSSASNELTAPVSFANSGGLGGINLSDSFAGPGASQTTGSSSLQLIVLTVAGLLALGLVVFLAFQKR